MKTNPPDNAKIAAILGDVADLLEIQGANPFRVRAYRNAIRTIETQTTPIAKMIAEGADLRALPGVGADMESHLRELVATGKLVIFDELAREIPLTLLELLRLPGLGPKKAKKLWQELGVTSLAELEAAAKAGRIATLEGFGPKSEQKLLAGLADLRQHASRFRLDVADRLIAPLVERLRAAPGVERLEVAGSYRRRKETVGDIDLLAIADDAAPVMQAFTSYPAVERIDGAGSTRGTVVLESGLQVDLRIVPRESYGAALVYFTGSKEHNVRLRQRAVERGLKLNEYGVFRADDEDPRRDSGRDPSPRHGERVDGAEEADVYTAVGLPWIAPELREDRGEIDAAEHGELPRLLELEDLRGDLHMHSTWSDGKASIEEMLGACAARGYDYFAITDHSKAVGVVGGLDGKRLREQWQEIDEIRARFPDVRLLRGMEVDILADGALDLEDELLFGLDLVIVSVHSRFELPAAEQTKRILKAISHPAVHLLAHPTGRLLPRRKPYELDLDEVLHAAAELGVAVELNANPERLDLKDTHLMQAKKLGCKILINTDAHAPAHLDLTRYGVDQARRAGLEAKDVLNTLPFATLTKALRQR